MTLESRLSRIEGLLTRLTAPSLADIWYPPRNAEAIHPDVVNSMLGATSEHDVLFWYFKQTYAKLGNIKSQGDQIICFHRGHWVPFTKELSDIMLNNMIHTIEQHINPFNNYLADANAWLNVTNKLLIHRTASYKHSFFLKIQAFYRDRT